MKSFKKKSDYVKAACCFGAILGSLVVWLITAMVCILCIKLGSTCFGVLPLLMDVFTIDMTLIESLLSIIAMCAVLFVTTINYVLPLILAYVAFKLSNMIQKNFLYEKPKKIEDPLFEDD